MRSEETPIMERGDAAPVARASVGRYPGLVTRICSVWYRHFRVYTRNLISNGLPPFKEPLIFLAGIGLGLGGHIKEMMGLPYVVFLASASMASPAMFTAAFEASYGTFIRMEFDKVYDGMISASITVTDLFLGEILFCGTKGFFFSAAVLCVISIFGLVSFPSALLGPVGGFLTGTMFAALSLFVTSFVTTISHFNFYFTGFLTPLFFFSGMVFPLSNLPKGVQWVAEALPLTHSVKFVRAAALNRWTAEAGVSMLYMIGFTLLFSWLAIRRLKRRIID